MQTLFTLTPKPLPVVTLYVLRLIRTWETTFETVVKHTNLIASEAKAKVLFWILAGTGDASFTVIGARTCLSRAKQERRGQEDAIGKDGDVCRNRCVSLLHLLEKCVMFVWLVAGGQRWISI